MQAHSGVYNYQYDFHRIMCFTLQMTKPNFNITDLEGSTPLACVDTLSLGLLQATDKLTKNYLVVPN